MANFEQELPPYNVVKETTSRIALDPALTTESFEAKATSVADGQEQDLDFVMTYKAQTLSLAIRDKDGHLDIGELAYRVAGQGEGETAIMLILAMLSSGEPLDPLAVLKITHAYTEHRAKSEYDKAFREYNPPWKFSDDEEPRGHSSHQAAELLGQTSVKSLIPSIIEELMRKRSDPK